MASEVRFYVHLDLDALYKTAATAGRDTSQIIGAVWRCAMNKAFEA